MKIEKLEKNKWCYEYNENYYYIEIDKLLEHWLSRMPNSLSNDGILKVNKIDIEKILKLLIQEDLTRNYFFTESDLLQFKIAISRINNNSFSAPAESPQR